MPLRTTGLPLRVVTALSLTVLVGCGSSGTRDPTSPGGRLPTSHNAGRDCLGCHSFTLAGTVYQADGVTASPAALIHLTSAPGATAAVDLTLTADGSGSFYTNSRIDFGAGLVVTATAPGGTARTMSTPVTSGACNDCHTPGQRLRTN